MVKAKSVPSTATLKRAGPAEPKPPIELRPEEARKTFAEDAISCESTADIQPLEGIIGQARALHALEFGLGIEDRGYNIFVAGADGTGKTTAIKSYLTAFAQKKPAPPDWCYVYNFKEPSSPIALKLPTGKGKEFQRDMEDLVETAKREVTKAFESRDYSRRRDDVLQDLGQQRDALIQQVEQHARHEGFTIQSTPVGLLIIAVAKGKPLSDEEVASLSPEVREVLNKKRQTLEKEVKEVVAQVRVLEKEVNERLEKMDQEVAAFVLQPLNDDLMRKYTDPPEVGAHLKDVEQDMLEHVELFRPRPQQEASPFPMPWLAQQTLRRYQVNVIADNSSTKGAPIILELNPTYTNLIGRVEKESQFGALMTDFTMIKPGSLHEANGGYLVMRIEDLLKNTGSWESLKRALRDRELVIEDLGEKLGFFSTKSLDPLPIPLNVKVVLTGNPSFYYLLHSYDPDFIELFKVKAEFDSRMNQSPENIKDYVAFLCTTCNKEKLRHLETSGIAKVLEHSVRLAGEQSKLSTRFSEIVDLLREADYWASKVDAKLVSAAHVAKAIESKVYRSALIQERIIEAIDRDIIKIDIDGESAGQVNGLAVLSLGDFSFGKPSRITATVSPGREGVVDIEREARLGGPIHTKGVLILSGFLVGRYAQKIPLSFSARLVFEQNYEGVEGDSASSTEVYAILSRLSDLPIKQYLAVTGSVNQNGEVQAIGGVNEKVEGFFDVCKVKGLTGRQGALIPKSNVKDLMLREDIVEAIRQGKFHLYPIRHIDEGIEVLTGVPAGQRDEKGEYPQGTVNYLVDQRLKELAKGLREFGKPDGEEKAKSKAEENNEKPKEPPKGPPKGKGNSNKRKRR